MTSALIARPTTYNGIRMRSRLEAKVAAEMDRHETAWAYEPRAYANGRGQYLPDFELLAIKGVTPARPTFMEVRPTLERAYLAMAEMPIIWDSEPNALLVIHVPDVIDFFAWGDLSRTWVSTGDAR